MTGEILTEKEKRELTIPLSVLEKAAVNFRMGKDFLAEGPCRIASGEDTLYNCPGVCPSCHPLRVTSGVFRQLINPGNMAEVINVTQHPEINSRVDYQHVSSTSLGGRLTETTNKTISISHAKKPFKEEGKTYPQGWYSVVTHTNRNRFRKVAITK